MAAVLGGLGTAIIWSVGSVGASRAARQIGPFLTLAWVMLIGLGLTAVLLPVAGSASISGTAIVWLVLSGAGNVAGLLLVYRALRLGRLGVVMPIATTEGGIAALIAILAGQSVGAVRGGALLATMVGVLLTASSSGPDGAAADAPAKPLPPGGSRAVANPVGHGDRRAAGWAGAGALCFGIGLYTTARAGAALPVVWAVMPPRVLGVVAVTIPLALGGRLSWPRGCGRWLVLSGACEVGGFLAYALAARHSIPVAAVLATLTGTFGTALGWRLFGERLRPRQLLGGALIFAGVATLSALGS